MKWLKAPALALALAILAAGFLGAATTYIGREIVAAAQHERLELTAHLAATNANATYQRAASALRSIAGTDFVPCSPQHIARMRDLVSATAEINAIGYFDSAGTTCSSWGASSRAEPPAADYRRTDAIGIIPVYQPVNSRSGPQIRLSLASYGITIEPRHFINVRLPGVTGLAVFVDDGHLLARMGEQDAQTMAAIWANTDPATEGKVDFVRESVEGWTAIATAPPATLLAFFLANRNHVLASSGLFGILVFAIALWLLQRRRSPLGELAIAVRKREFIVHYQPIMELKTGRCYGAEALIRWQRPDGEMVRPDLFIPLAEESGLIKPITDQLIEIVMGDLEKLLVEDRSLHIAINLCASDITTGRVFQLLKKELTHRDIRPHQIWIEATERSFVDVELARASVVKARHLGHAVAIDDFGTGYSSLQYLQDLPVDALKIDKSFIDTIGQNSASSSVTPYIIEMAKALNLVIIAEGVETQSQADYLTEMNVQFGQGWLFSKALPRDAFIAFCHSRGNVGQMRAPSAG